MGITAGSREVPGRNACDRRHAYCIIIIIIITGRHSTPQKIRGVLKDKMGRLSNARPVY